MKTKLFSLFIAVFLFSLSGNSQSTPTCPPSWPYAHCISLIGPGVSDWSTDVYLTSADGDVFTLGDVQIKETSPGSGIGGDLKFRRDGCWDECSGNPAGYSSATGSGFPIGSGESVPFGPNIKPTPGVWNVTFTLSTKSWEFTAGTPNPTVKIFGTATTPATGVSMFATSATTFEIKKLPLLAANAQFEINTNPGGAPALLVIGGTTFPDGTADDETKFIPVSAANDYDVTLDIASGAYTFKVATFPSIALVGAAAGGWPTGAVGEVDDQVMTTTDGVNYTLNNVPMIPGGCVFRANNAWDVKYGNTPFPTGTNDGGKDIIVPAGMGGTYNVTLNVITGAYDFGTALAVTKFDASSFKVYPNPTRGSWNITSGNDDITSIQVYDVQGKAVYTKFGASKEVNVNASELSKGVYFAKVSTANGSSTLKLVKE